MPSSIALNLTPAQKALKIKREQHKMYTPYRSCAKRLLKRFSSKSSLLSQKEKNEVEHAADDELNYMIGSVISRDEESCCFPLCEDEPVNQIEKRESFCDTHAKQKILALLAVHLSMKQPNEIAITNCLNVLRTQFKESIDLEIMFYKHPELLKLIKKNFDT